MGEYIDITITLVCTVDPVVSCSTPATLRVWRVTCLWDCTGYLACEEHAAKERALFRNGTRVSSDLTPRTTLEAWAEVA